MTMVRTTIFGVAGLLLACLASASAFAQNPSSGAMRPEIFVARGWNWNAEPQAEPPCAPATTTGTITLTLGKCSNPVDPTVGGSPDNWQFTLTGNATLAVTGPYRAGQTFIIKVTEGASTPFTLSVPAGFSVPGICTGSGTPVSYCTLANELVLSGVTGGQNMLTCSVINTSPTIWCGPVNAGLTTALPILVQNSFLGCPSPGSGDSTGATTCSSSTLTLTAGNDLIVAVGNCVTNSCSGASTLVVNTLSGTNLTSCAFLTHNAGSAPMKSELWRCHVNASGATHAAITWSSNAFFGYTHSWEVQGLAASPDDGVGATASGTGITPTAALTGGGATQNNSEMVILTVYCNTDSEAISGTGWVSEVGQALNSAHKFTTASGAQTPTIGCSTNTGINPWTSSIAALKHP